MSLVLLLVWIGLVYIVSLWVIFTTVYPAKKKDIQYYRSRRKYKSKMY